MILLWRLWQLYCAAVAVFALGVLLGCIVVVIRGEVSRLRTWDVPLL